MAFAFAKLEQNVFRRLNAIVEPAVRWGIASPGLAPANLIVLETVSFKSGEQRLTPLWSIYLGRYRLVSAACGDRSFWVKNLMKQPTVPYYLGGKQRPSNAIIFAPGTPEPEHHLPPLLGGLASTFF